MIHKTIEFLSSLKMTVISGLFLLISFILILTEKTLPLDPVWITTAVSGFPLFYNALKKLFIQKKISSALLISIAMTASIAIGEVFAAGEIAFIMAIGGILEDKTVERAKKGIKKLINLIPEQARRISYGNNGITVETVAVEEIKENDILRILPGETIPVDGQIISGNTSVNQSVITGESLPADKMQGDSVFCGTLNLFGSVDIKAVKTGSNTSLQKLIKLVNEAEKNKAPMQRIVDKWAGWLVPAALLTAVITHFATGDIIRAVTVLVVFCPCALALATPTSIVAAIGQATKFGVIIKSGEALEKMGKVNCIVFDKTGTITKGTLTVSDVAPVVEISKEKLLNYAAAAESLSEHPIGKAVVNYAKELNVKLTDEPKNFKMIPGKGISAQIKDSLIICGNKKFLEENGVIINKETEDKADILTKQGKAVILVAADKFTAGIIALSDTLRPNIAETVKELKSANAETIMLTGDNKETADYIAAKAGIEKVYSHLLPENKVSIIKKLQKEGRIVAMTGDGINDAPALKTADVGISMGTIGSDIAVEAADITLISDDIAAVTYLKRLSVSTVNTIKFNITLSMLINVIAVILSIMALLNPITGALVHNIGSVLVVSNAALLYDRKFR